MVGGVGGIILGGFVPVEVDVWVEVCMQYKYICFAGFWQSLVGSGWVSMVVSVLAIFRSLGFGYEGCCTSAGGGG